MTVHSLSEPERRSTCSTSPSRSELTDSHAPPADFEDGSTVEPIVLTADTKQISGWLYTAGELSVMGTRDPEEYDPYPKDQALRCVSLIDETGVAYRDLSQLNLKHVVVTGYVLNYDDLPIGQDQFMVRRYWKEKVLVRNSCVRDQVFVATAIEAK